MPLYRGEATPELTAEAVVKFTTLPPGEGYIMSPTYAELKEMPAIFLRKVPNFTISNAFG